ncbi:DUF3455 domain-containing protein [Amorphoplanes digitatis]|uniref:DUF3455 domain-containing protein n=1 Tax=Actinoplanes digitatis TaxID=1868 RepID=A0A7W7MPJ3_9ACTN|nr:DUF3455 domain-containing protein [Actinoplanes digitatis]MBB4762201.1 hypothetical protein [Actinoplanes digitatis]BFE70974.1 DUF3455 domain-containing protein [Actinoplanes digitatis]GID97769.1 hypothetical protein Adi01nite_71810 [Actinoplanes digitatis]
MTRSLRISAGVGVAVLALVGTSSGVSFADDLPAPVTADRFLGGPSSVPPELVPPAGNTLTSVFKAKGVQVYGCTDAKWTLIEPAASLTGITLRPVRPVSALHFRGPSWESDEDGSLIEGTAPKPAPSDTPNSIPQLLVTGARTRGPGVFGDVTYIQRLSTVGGVAPATACAAGATTSVPYRAVYRFFKKG